MATVSIHAPLRGATERNNLRSAQRNGFNPRTPAGCDKYLMHCSVITYMSFNPRTPAGCDKPCMATTGTPVRFNPRTPAGCDAFHRSRMTWHPCRFNPRTPAGCDTIVQAFFESFIVVSIHAPLRGATELAMKYQGLVKFQSTHPCGVRQPAPSGTVI